VVVDELHLLGDPHRGRLLEHMLTRLVVHNRAVALQKLAAPAAATGSGGPASVPADPVQLVGMTATISAASLKLVSTFLDAAVRRTGRPNRMCGCTHDLVLCSCSLSAWTIGLWCCRRRSRTACAWWTRRAR
jgi:hypothetical protein